MAFPKIQDTFNDRSSAADIYWSDLNFRSFYKKFRGGNDVPKNFMSTSNSELKIIDRYHLRGFQFGHWVTNEDRHNYLAAFYICLYDLQKVLRFKNSNLGLDGRLGISIGSRGVPSAKAHYEPLRNVINIARYKRQDVMRRQMGKEPSFIIPKSVRFLQTGGIGSFAHEYGHFLDLNFGAYIEPSKHGLFLTGPMQSVSRSRIEYSKMHPMRVQVENIFEKIWFKKNGEYSKYDERLKATESAYLNNRQEIFARLFEQYIAYKLSNHYGVVNSFLFKSKYKRVFYLQERELKPIIPEMDKLMDLIRKSILNR